MAQQEYGCVTNLDLKSILKFFLTDITQENFLFKVSLININSWVEKFWYLPIKIQYETFEFIMLKKIYIKKSKLSLLKSNI